MNRAWIAALAVGCHGVENKSPVVGGKPVETPTASAATVKAAERVDRVGQHLVSASPFLGVSPMFHTVSLKDPVVFHPDLNGLMVSDSLVERCKSDDMLAGVLASELGQMAAERRTADRLKDPAAKPATDPTAEAKGILHAAGYRDADLEAAEPLLEAARKNRGLTAGLVPKSSVPVWSP